MQKVKTALLKRQGFDYYVLNLKLINILAEEIIKPREIDVLASIMLHKEVNKDTRKLIMSELKISAPNLSNHLKTLSKKGLLRKDKTTYYVNQAIIPEPDIQEYKIQIDGSGQ